MNVGRKCAYTWLRPPRDTRAFSADAGKNEMRLNDREKGSIARRTVRDTVCQHRCLPLPHPPRRGIGCFAWTFFFTVVAIAN